MTWIEPYDIHMYDFYYTYICVTCIKPHDTYIGMTCLEPYDMYTYDLYCIYIYVNCIEPPRHMWVWLAFSPTTCICMTCITYIYMWIALNSTTLICMTCIEPYDIYIYDLYYYIYGCMTCIEPYYIYMYCTLRALRHRYVWLALVIHIYVMKSPTNSPTTSFGATTASWIFVTLWRHELSWTSVIQCAAV